MSPQAKVSASQRGRGLLPFYLIEGGAICSDVILIVGTSVLTGIAYHLTVLNQAGPIDRFIAVGLLTCITFSAILAASSAYRPQDLVDFGRQVWLTAVVWLFVFFVLSTVAFAFKIGGVYSRGAVLTFFVLGWTAVVAWRFVLARYLTRAMAEGRFLTQKVIVLVEQGQLDGSSIFEELRRCGYEPARKFQIVRDQSGSKSSSFHFTDPLDEIIKTSRQESIQCVFILVRWDDWPSIKQLMQELSVLSLPIYLLPDSNVAHFLGARMVNIGTAWTAELKRAPLSRIEQTSKRAFDFITASLGLIMLAPTMLLVAAIIKIESRGPVLFMQTRNGFNGRPFRMCKFRTMSVLEDGLIIRQATKNDPRFTRIGRVLRRTNIDELPQLLNVIAGDMSLVGPRPHASAHNTAYEKAVANYAFRYHVKPGLTGWAQIHGLRGETETIDLMEKRVEYDLWYINNWSFRLDLRILLRTLTIGLQPTAY